MKTEPCVYFVSDGQGHCKIGVASNLTKRMNNLQVGSAYELNIKHIIYTDSLNEAYEIEKKYHAALSSKIVRGEWFDEKAIDDYLNGNKIDDGKVYMCDACPEFDIMDALKLYCILLTSKTKEEVKERYEAEMPEYWKKYDQMIGKIDYLMPIPVVPES